MKLYIEKNIIINKDRESVARTITNFEKWKLWSPWYAVEKTVQQSISGNPHQKGHTMQWEGEITGSGSNTLIGISNERIDFDLQFIKPWKSQADISFVLTKINENQTKVSWVMDSSLPFFLFFMKNMMTEMIGQDYERGLLMLKTVLETGQLETESIDKGISDFSEVEYIGFANTVTFKNMPKSMEADFTKLMEVSEKVGKSAKEWMTIYTKHSFAKGEVSYIAAISAENFKDTPETMVRGKIENGKVFTVLHEGSYDFLGNSWNKAMMTAKARKMKVKKYPFERYLNDPFTTDEKDLKTEIILPLKYNGK